MMTPVLPPLLLRSIPAPVRTRLRIAFQLALWLGVLWTELFLIAMVRSRASHAQAVHPRQDTAIASVAQEKMPPE